MTHEQLVKLFVDEILIGGTDGSGIRCGIIGEVGFVYPAEVNEKRFLLATADAQKEIGAPVNIHPGLSLICHDCSLIISSLLFRS